MSPRYDVFLSHSSADKPAVEELARKLQAVGIKPFLDQWHLVPGEPWQEALEQALDDSRTCAVFVGPQGIGPWQNEEMRSALEDRVRDKAIRVIPVLLPGALESQKEKLPRFLRRLNWVDFRAGLDDEDAFHRLLSGIRGTAPGPGGGGGGEPAKPSLPYLYRSMAQPPEGFIHRREYDEVLEALCPADGAVRSTSVGITTALRGAGGFGKTALAQALCQNPRVRQTYPDGILWATMGEDIDANGRLARVRDLIRWWTEEEEEPTFENVSAAASRLRELLAGRRVLIVVDDVWSPADVTPFQGIGAEAALLITTRDSQTLPLEAARVQVDAMASLEAVSLLRAGLPDGSDDAYKALAGRLGEWPLLLKIINRQIRELVQRDHLSPEEALQEVEEALDAQGLTAFDRNIKEERNRAISLTINASLTRLSEEEREHYGQLAIFPEDTDVPLSVLSCLWRLDFIETKTLCGRLYDLSLLLDFNRRSGTIRLHDVIRQFLIRQRQGDLPALHGRLLDSCPCWQDLPREKGYLWRHLASHLLGAGRREELRELLLDFCYLQAKLEATDINALIADYEPFSGEEDPRLIRDAIRLSAHVLIRDRLQLAPQLIGRLKARNEQSLQRLVRGAESWTGGCRLRPRTASLTQPGGALIRVLEGHTDGVTAVAVVDGRRAVSASDDGTLRVWDLESGQTLRTLEGHTDSVRAVAVVDGCRAVSASDDGTLRVWDLETGQTLSTLEGHTEGVMAVAVVDSRRAVSASSDETLRVWDLETGQTLSTLEGHTDGVTAVAVVDGRRAVSASWDRTLRVWDLETGQTLSTLEGHTSGVTAVAAVDGRCVVSASDDRTLRVWDLETGQTLSTLEGHTSGVTTVAAVDGRRAVSASNDETLRVWDLESGQALSTLKGHTSGVTAVAVVDGRRAVSASDDETLRVWDLESGQTLRTLEGHTYQVTAVVVVDSRRAVSASNDWTLRVWNLETGQTLRTLEGHTGGVTAVAVVDGRRAVSASNDRTLRVWDLKTGQTLCTLEGHTGSVTTVAVVDGRRAVSASYARTLRVWDLETGQTLRTLEGHTDWVTAVAVVDGRRAVSASHDETLRVWDLETGQTLRTLEGHTGCVRAVAMVDGRHAVSASWDRTLRVWDLETGETLRALEGHSGRVFAVAVVDGRRAVSGSDDGTLQVWDLETEETLAMLTLDATALVIAVSPDRHTVVAGDRWGKVHFLNLVEPEANQHP